jgi:predicted DNA binding CopG/RHH family protein
MSFVRLAWDETKNLQLTRERGLSSDDVENAIELGKVLDDLPHPNALKYPNQRILVVEIDEFICIVPYVSDGEVRFLKTVYPSRKSGQNLSSERPAMTKTRKAPEFLDAEEKDLVESFESALEKGERAAPSNEARAGMTAEWQEALTNTTARKAITLRLQTRDIDRLKTIARQRGLPYQTLVTSVLHQFANGDLKEIGR